MGGAIVLTLVGQGGNAALVVLFGGLVAVLLLAVRGTRPSSSGSRGRRPRRARRINFLARYQPVDELEELSVIVIAALAAWSVFELIDEASVPLLLTVGVLAPAIGFVVARNAVATVLGLLGAAAATATVFTRVGCGEPVSDQGRAVYTVIVVTSVAVFILVRSGLLPLPRPLGRSISLGVAALVVFGLLETTSFVVRPNGIDLWVDAPGWAKALALVLVVVIAFFAAYAPKFVVDLLALAVVVGQLALAAVEAGALHGTEGVCGDPVVGLIYAGAFTLVALVGISLKPGRQK